MGEHNDKVERQRILLEAEEWAGGVRSLHTHKMQSMWYDDRPQDTQDSMVTDIQYNDGRIERRKEGKVIHVFGKAVRGEELMNAYLRGGL